MGCSLAWQFNQGFAGQGRSNFLPQRVPHLVLKQMAERRQLASPGALSHPAAACSAPALLLLLFAQPLPCCYRCMLILCLAAAALPHGICLQSKVGFFLHTPFPSSGKQCVALDLVKDNGHMVAPPTQTVGRIA